MAGIKISQLDNAAKLANNDLMIVVQDGVTKKGKISDIQTLVNANIGNVMSDVGTLNTEITKLSNKIEPIENNYASKTYLTSKLDSTKNEIQLWANGQFAKKNESSDSDYSYEITNLKSLLTEVTNKVSNCENRLTNLSNIVENKGNDLSNYFNATINNISSEIGTEIDNLSTFVNALFELSSLSNGADLLTATRKLNEKLNELSSISNDIESYKTNISELVDALVENFNEISSYVENAKENIEKISDLIYLNQDNTDYYTTNPISLFFNPLEIEVGNKEYRIDDHAFRNAGQKDDSSTITDKFNSNYFNSDGYPIRSGMLSAITSNNESNYILKTNVLMDSDVLIYACKKHFFKNNDQENEYDVKSIMRCSVNDKEIPFLYSNSNIEDNQNDAVLKFYGKLSAGSTISIFANNDDIKFNSTAGDSTNTSQSIYEALNKDIGDDKRLIEEDNDRLIGIIDAIPTHHAIKQTNKWIFDGFCFNIAEIETHDTTIDITTQLSNKFYDNSIQSSFLSSISIPISSITYTITYEDESQDEKQYVDIGSTEMLSLSSSNSIIIYGINKQNNGSDIAHISFIGKFANFDKEVSFGTISPI